MNRKATGEVNRRLRSLYTWHRWLGIIATLFVLLFALTGLALNHSSRLGLDQSYLSNNAWQQLYQLDNRIDVSGFQQAGQWFSQADGRLYLNSQFITHGSAPVGVTRLNETWVVACPAELLLLDDAGLVLERIGAAQLPGRILAVQSIHGQLVIHTPYADFSGDLDSLNWQPLSAALSQPTAVQSGSPPSEIANQIRKDLRSHAISVERLLLDLHSGRLWGLLGVIIMDSAAVVLITLGLTGLLLWLRHRRKQQVRRRRARQKRRERKKTG